ncbi:beta-glucosidase [Prolixibacteraceae bacterium JC049]|nr:beta-glucosidase [Prolixibacteraceae bacterium JC049]
MKAFFSLALVFVAFATFAQKDIYHKNWIDFNKNGQLDPFENPNEDIEKRVADLLSQMTVNEKTGQMATLYGYARVLKDELPTPDWKNKIWKDGIANIDEHLNCIPFRESTYTKHSFPHRNHAKAINIVQRWFVEETRLGIPVDFTNEAIHGLCHDRATPLPAPIGVGATWNKNLVRKAGEIIGQEARALGYTNVYVPILDLARDPRWGRVMECYSEDPYQAYALGKEMVLGVQDQNVAATLKHFAVYSVPKGARDGDARTDPHVAPREMHQLYNYPFKRVIQETNPKGIMSSYNDYDGIPVTGSHYFLTELLREQYGFKGYVVSDSRAVEYLFEKHKVAKDRKEGVRQVVEAGLNVRTRFSKPEEYLNPLRELVNEGKIAMATIDKLVAEVLRVKFQLGLFDQPYVQNEKLADKVVHTKEAEEFSKQVNREALVLLKNENNLLPLDVKKLDKVLVTGPMAAEINYAYSRYGPANNEVVTVLDGIKNYHKSLKVDYAKGCDIIDKHWPMSEIIDEPLTAEEQKMIDEAVAKAKESDVVIAVVGEGEKEVGECKSRTSLNLPGRQLQLLKALHQTGKPVVMVMINGRPLTINWEDKYLPAILEAWFPSVCSGTVIAETLFGDYNPGGKLNVTFPKSVGQIPLNFPAKPGSQAGQPKVGPNGFGATRVLGALYPFGYGLSYTTFKYSNLKITRKTESHLSNIKITADITNTGQREGDEVVQLYVKDKVSSVITYEQILRGFERVHLKAGETKTVSFEITPEDLEILDKNMKWVVEPGEFQFLIGASSTDIKLKQTINLK